MNRPTHTSSLAGYTPAAPAPLPPARPAADDEMRKLTVRLPNSLIEEVRAAYFQTRHLSGERTLAEWIERALTDRLEEARTQYNQAHPFTRMPAGSIGTGRPTD